MLIHVGESGLDGTSILPDPIRSAAIAEGDAAVLAMHQALSGTAPQTAWLVSTGALTNIALLFNLFPTLVDHIAGLSIMGGAIGQFFTHAPIGRFTEHPQLANDLHRKFPNGLTDASSWSSGTLLQHFQDLGVIRNEQQQDDERLKGLLDAARNSFGNTTDYAEFNIYCDPEAAASIFSNQRLAAKTTLIPLDITHQVLGDENVLRLLSKNHTGNDKLAESPIRHLFLEIMTFFAHTYEREFGMSDGPPLHDPIAVAVAFAPGMFDDNDGERFEVFVIRAGDERLFDNERQVDEIGQCGRTVAKMVASGQAGVRIPRTLRIPEFWNLIDLALDAADQVSNLTF
jgi:uridine nucleosidase